MIAQPTQHRPRAVIRDGAGLSLELPADDHIVGPWLRRTVPTHERLEAGGSWLIGDAFAAAALEAARAAYPDLDVNAPARADEEPPAVRPGALSYDDPRRKFLERFPTTQCGHIMNMFLLPIRQGVSEPAEIVRRVEHSFLQRECNGVRYRDLVAQQRARWVLDGLSAYPDEALALAGWAVEYEALPPAERERLKLERGADHRRDWMSRQEPTPKQLAYIRALGFTGRVESRQHAADLIESLKGAKTS
jgi:hypothetical protein